jgi:polyhydroxyalkanoate synthesis regulator protein
VGAYEDQIRQNLQLFDRAMKMFSPFSFNGQGEAAAQPPPAARPEPPPDDALSQLRRQMAEMQAQIDKLAKS